MVGALVGGLVVVEWTNGTHVQVRWFILFLVGAPSMKGGWTCQSTIQREVLSRGGGRGGKRGGFAGELGRGLEESVGLEVSR